MQDTNLNFSKCLKDVTDFGVTHVHNICSGTVTDVPGGSVEWLGAVFLLTLGLSMVAMLGGLATAMIWDF